MDGLLIDINLKSSIDDSCDPVFEWNEIGCPCQPSGIGYGSRDR